MQLERVKSAIEAIFPAAKVEVKIEENGIGKFLHGNVIGSVHSEKKTFELVYKSLSNAGLVNFFDAISIVCYPSHGEWMVSELNNIVRSALNPLSRKFDRYIEVDLKIVGDTLFISASPSLDGSVSEQIDSVLGKLLEVSKATSVSIKIDSGFPSYSMPNSLDFDEDDESNPNWPSRTGNLSGGGRGNNPPK